jgi:hypothetical protein
MKRRRPRPHAAVNNSNLTVDRSEARALRQPSARKPIADGGSVPHVGDCACKARVIFHKRAGGGTVKLEQTEALTANGGDGRFVIFQGFALVDPDPMNVPKDWPVYREHVCNEEAPHVV